MATEDTPEEDEQLAGPASARRVSAWNWRRMEQERFQGYILEALEALPATFRDKMENVEIVVEPWPNAQTLRQAGVSHPNGLLGFYHGVPQTRRTHQYGLVLPDKISLYLYPILLRCSSAQEVREMVRHVLYHELAHHFGIDDNRLHEIGAY